MCSLFFWHIGVFTLMTSLLLTSFAPWRAHQLSNTSDDIIALLQSRNQLPKNSQLIRHLPVHYQLAPCQVISAMLKTHPRVVVCCGMAEKRLLLNLEQYAQWDGKFLETSLNLYELCADTQWTRVSHDAGTYVCNYLYYQLLAHVHKHRWPIQCLFVHVPLLTRENRELIARDFALILSRLQTIQNRSLELIAA